jgi:hypothetical protein
MTQSKTQILNKNSEQYEKEAYNSKGKTYSPLALTSHYMYVYIYRTMRKELLDIYLISVINGNGTGNITLDQEI